MSEGLAIWPTLFLLGAYHGINPGMGWLFAVARGMQEHRARAVAWSLPPIALGHALSIGAVILIAGLAQGALPLMYIRIGVAVALVGLGAYKLIRSRHLRWGGMQVGFRELTVWSFLMASAHGAGLMVLPVVLAGPHVHQRGGIPVALTLQQLQTAMHDTILAYTTGTNPDSITADIQKCETDFVLIVEAPRTRTLQIAIGECKSDGGEITADDVTKLTRVADAPAVKRSCEAFIAFSKTSRFTPEEVERCKAAQAKYNRRVILLSERGLKPYYLYEQTVKEFEIDEYASSLEQMARATHNIYFEPRPKPAIH
jgi:hypothetical protein